MTTPPAAGDTHNDPLVIAAAGELEGHQIEWVDDEVGYECGCNEFRASCACTVHTSTRSQARSR